MFHSERITRFRENEKESSSKTCEKQQCIGVLTWIITKKKTENRKQKTMCRWQKTNEKNGLSNSKIKDVSTINSKIEATEIMKRQFYSFSYRPHTLLHTNDLSQNEKRQNKNKKKISILRGKTHTKSDQTREINIYQYISK